MSCCSNVMKARRLAGPSRWRVLLLLLRRFVLVGLIVLLLLVLLGGLLPVGGLGRGLVGLSSSNIDLRHRTIFRISTQRYFRED
jgi:hypothetical protein